jgi:hypothetical protein
MVLEEISRRKIGALDEVIVDLHEAGETVFQAMGRAARFPEVDRSGPALLTEVPEGRMPLAQGTSVDLLRLDARGVAAILDFEIESAEYDASRSLLDEPRIPAEPRLPVQDLWPDLQAAGYRVGDTPRSPRRYERHRAALAHSTGVHVRRIHRICSGHQKTVLASDAVALLEAVGRYDQSHELDEQHLVEWRTKRAFAYDDLFEYRDTVARLAPSLRNNAGVTDEQALSDMRWLSIEAQRIEAPEGRVLTAEERILEADQRFEAVHGRAPVPLTPRLREQVCEHLVSQRERAQSRAHELRRGIPSERTLTYGAVDRRTYRLRRGEHLPRRSRPQSFRPPVHWTSAIERA